MPIPSSWRSSARGSGKTRTCPRRRCGTSTGIPTIRGLTAALLEAAPPSAGPAGAPSEQPAPTAPPAPPQSTGRWNHVLCGVFQLLFFVGYSLASGLVTARGYEWISAGAGAGEHLSPVAAVRRDRIHRPVHFSGPGEMGAHRPLETGRVSGLGADLSPLLARQGAAARESDDFPRRNSVVRAVSSGPGRADRKRCHDFLPLRPGLHRPADDRRGDRRPQGHVLPGLPGVRGPYPDGPGHPRPGRVRRREDRPGHRHHARRRRAAGPFLGAAPRAGDTGRRTLARFPGGARGRRLRPGRAGPVRHRAPGLVRSGHAGPAVLRVHSDRHRRGVTWCSRGFRRSASDSTRRRPC